MRRLTKNLFTIAVLILISLSVATPVLAISGEISSQNLFEQWEENGYPGDIGGVYYDSDADMLGFLIVAPTTERMDELRAMLIDEVLFTPCKYPYNELRLVQEEMHTIMSSDSGVYSTGIGWISTDGNVHGFGESGKEFRLVVGVDESVFDHYYKGLVELYGDRVVVEVSGPIVTNDSLGGNEITSERDPIVPVDISAALSGSAFFGANNVPNNTYWIWAVFSVGLLGALLILLRLRSHSVPAKQTANGNIVAGNHYLSKKQVVTMVKDNEDVPRSDLFDSIIQSIDTTVSRTPELDGKDSNPFYDFFKS